MIVPSALLVVGLASGLRIRRWRYVAAVILVGLTTSLTGWLTGWAGSPDMPAAGGAIILAAVVWLPLVLGAALGVGLGRARRRGK